MPVPSILYDISNRAISFQAVHITDIHVKDQNATYVSRIAALKAKIANHSIDYILNTGDTADSAPTSADAEVEDLVADLTAIKPMITARGNHDGSVTNAQLGMPVDNWYYQDITGTDWRVIVLYSQGGGNYSLGATQTTWLTDTLAASTSKYVILMSHVPFCSVAALMWYLRNSQAWGNTTDYHSDAKEILDIVKANPNIKVCLSGHEHTIDRVEHEGVVYLCSGAVSANWWGDNTYTEKGYPAGYRLIDFYNNGTIKEKFLTY